MSSEYGIFDHEQDPEGRQSRKRFNWLRYPKPDPARQQQRHTILSPRELAALEEIEANFTEKSNRKRFEQTRYTARRLGRIATSAPANAANIARNAPKRTWRAAKAAPESIKQTWNSHRRTIIAGGVAAAAVGGVLLSQNSQERQARLEERVIEAHVEHLGFPDPYGAGVSTGLLGLDLIGQQKTTVSFLNFCTGKVETFGYSTEGFISKDMGDFELSQRVTLPDVSIDYFLNNADCWYTGEDMPPGLPPGGNSGPAANPNPPAAKG